MATGEVDLPSAGEVHDLIIPVVLGGVVASHLAVAEAEHIAHGVEGRVHNRVSGGKEVGEEAVVRGADVGVIVRHDPPAALGYTFSVLRNDQPEVLVGRQRGAHVVMVPRVLIDHPAAFILPRAVERDGQRGVSG